MKTCENVKLRLNFIDFVNDINILMYDEFTKRNCEKKKDKIKSSKKHDFKFNERKHELIYFLKILKQYNINANITFDEH